jgi:ElaB/YqjD/DUF883 family membrane-anchored ribosome-binding protein
MAKLGDDNRAFFENTLKEAKKQIEIIDAKIEEELARVKETINQLQEQKKAVRQIYDGAAVMLGAKNEFDEEDDGVKEGDLHKTPE